MQLNHRLLTSAGPLYWGDFQTGWGNAVFVTTAKGLAALQPITDDFDLNRFVEQQAGSAVIQKLSAGQRILWSQKISEALANPTLIKRLPLYLQGSDFQLSVWQLLLQLKAGQTVTYSELAALIGRPQATRAVASACAANPVALLVPCHRVVRKDGGLGGYRWGLEMKRYLLKKEGAL